MKCFNHEDREAVATCQRCGKGLCKECASKYTPCLCDDCFEAIQKENHAQKVAAVEQRKQNRLEQLSFTTGDLILNCVFGAIFLGFVIFCTASNGDGGVLLEGYYFLPVIFCVPAGWRVVSRWIRVGEEQRGIVRTYHEPVMAWIAEFLVKFFISWFLGIPAFLFQIYKVLRAKKDVQVAEDEVSRVKSR